MVYAGDGLYLTYHRLYDANLKRFLQSDPKGIAGGVNLYAYGNLSPLVYVDPLGLCAESGVPSFTSFFGSEQFHMAASGWYGGTGIRLNTAQRVIAGAWGAVQAAAEVLTLGSLGGAGAIGTRGVMAGGSTLTAMERAYMTGAYSALRSPLARPMPLRGFTVTAGRRLTDTFETSALSPILRTQKQLSLLVNRQGAVVDRWLATSQNRWAQMHRANLTLNPNFAKGVRGRILDVRMRGKFRAMFGDVPGVRIDQTIPGSGSALRPDLYFPDLGGRSVIFDVGGPSKVRDILKYGGMADDLIPLVPEQWF